MNIADIVLLIVLLLAGSIGYKKGLLMEVVALLALLLGIIAGLVFVEQGKAFLSQFFDTYNSITGFFSFLLIFVCVVVLTSLVGRALKSTIHLTPIGYLDSVGGAILGVIKWIFFISVVLWIFDTAEIKISAVEESQWYSKVKLFAPVLIEQLKIWFPVLGDLMKEAREFLTL